MRWGVLAGSSVTVETFRSPYKLISHYKLTFNMFKKC